MAMRELRNEAESQGYINNILTPMTDAVTIQLIDGLTIEKTADKYSWSTGFLTFTITVTNKSGVTYENLQIFDVIAPDKAALVPNSVTFDDVTVYHEYNAATGALHIIPNPQLDLLDEEVAVFSFRVTKVDP